MKKKKTQIDLISISKLHSFKSPFKLHGFRPRIQEEKKVGLCFESVLYDLLQKKPSTTLIMA